MSEHHVCNVETRPDCSFEFGRIPQPEFVFGNTLSEVRSMQAPFSAVRPYMNGKPLRRPSRHSKRRCSVYLIPEDEGGFSVVAADLPGVASQGETEEEALANIKEAFEGVIRCYKNDSRKIPWLAEPEEPEAGALIRSVVVYG